MEDTEKQSLVVCEMQILSCLVSVEHVNALSVHSLVDQMKCCLEFLQAVNKVNCYI